MPKIKETTPLYILVIFLLFGLILVVEKIHPGQTDLLGAKRETVFVERVIDGDTIVLSDQERVRYIGVDAPEMRPEECFAGEATKKNIELVEGREVEMEKDISNTDRYGRLLRYVYVDGKMVNEILVLEGYARVATFPPDVKYKDVFLEAEREAREEGRGLWGENCNID